MEEWRDIEGYEGLYQVSNEGRIKSLPKSWRCGCATTRVKSESFLKPLDNTKHLQVRLYKNGKHSSYQIHRLVAEAFIPNPNNYDVVHHIDHNSKNNKVENLMWIKNENHNALHAIDRANAIKNKLSKQIYQYTLDGILVNVWKNAYEAAKQLGYTPSRICICCNGGLFDKRVNKWVDITQYKGFIWRYAEEI